MHRNNTTRDLLLLVDIQNDFCTGGALAVPDGEAVIPPANELTRRFTDVVLTQDWHPAGHLSFASSHPGRTPFEVAIMPYGPQTLWPDHCVQGTRGAAFHDELAVDRAQMTVRKGFRRDIDSYSALFENDRKTPTGLTGYMRERGFNRVFMAGLATDFCVLYSALDARRMGFEVFIVMDACRAIDMNGSLDEAIRQMDDAGVRRVHLSALGEIGVAG